MSKQQLVKKVELEHGVIITPDERRVVYRGAVDLVRPFTYELLQAVDGIDSLTFRPPTVGEVITASRSAFQDHPIGSSSYNQATAHNLIRATTGEDLSGDFFESLAGVDHDALQTIASLGRNPLTGRSAFRLDEEKAADTPGHSLSAFMRLHTQGDRSLANSNARYDRSEDPLGWELQLVWLVTSFATAPNFDRRGDIHSLMSVTWYDFQALTAGVVARDYEPLSEILTGDVEVGGSPLPFPGVPESDDQPVEESGGPADADAS